MKNNQNAGFSLIEVMVAVSIMGGMMAYLYKSFANQMKQQKTVMLRVEERNLVQDIRQLLMNFDNCSTSFEGQKFRLNTSGKDKLEKPIDSLQKVYIKQVKGKTEKTYQKKFERWISSKQEALHGEENLKISDYSFTFTKTAEKLLKDFKTSDINFNITFDRGQKSFGSRFKSYAIPLEVEVDKNLLLTRCSSQGASGSSGSSGMLLSLDIKYNPTISNLTGTQACTSKKMKCAYVQSTNYVLSTSGINASLYTPSCLSSYNKGLQGVKDGVGLSNIHSCSAKLGVFETFKINISKSTISCGGNFVAFCN